MPGWGCSRGGRERRADGAVTALSDLRPGQIALVTELAGHGRGARRLQDLGLAVGTTVEVLSGHGRGPVVVAAGDTRLAVGRGAANRVIVELLTP